MEQKKIPILNETFDIPLFILVLKKSIIYFIVIAILVAVSLFAYLRYTQPIYQANSIIQLKDEANKTKELLNIQSFYEEFNPNQTIELIKSKEFIKKVVSTLPVDVSYFNQGTFLQYELYKASPYIINYRSEGITIYDQPISIEFENIQKGFLFYKEIDDAQKINFTVNEWVNFNGSWLKVILQDSSIILSEQNSIKQNQYFFVLNNPEILLRRIISNLNVSVLNFDAKTIKIEYTDFNANKTAEITNSISEQFLKYDVDKKKESADKILEFIENQSAAIYNELDKIEEQLIFFRKQNNIKADEEKTLSAFRSLMDKTYRIETQMEDGDIEISAYNKALEYLKKDNISDVELMALIPQEINHPLLTSIFNELQSLIREREKAMNNVTTQSFQVQSIEKQIQNQKKVLIEFLHSANEKALDKMKYLKEQLSIYESEAYGSGATNDIEYSKILRLYNVNVEFFNNILGKKAEYLISQAGFVSQNIILENATVPNSPISPRKNFALIIAAVIFFVLSFIILFIRYLFHNEVYSVQDIRNYTNVPIIGTIPSFHENIPISRVLVDIKPNSVFSEAFRNIRSNIEFMECENKVPVIALSSTISGEGKTFVGLNLAGVYAFQGKKVIILDFDLRKPRIHHSFEQENKYGVSTILIGKTQLEECIHESQIRNLYYVTAGPIPPNPSELIKNAQLPKLLEKLRTMFDIIIIDTPPIGLVTDALELFKNADFQIYVLKSNYSKRVFLYNVNHLYEEKGFNKLSVVLNKIDLSASSLYGSYSHHYGYGYYSYETSSTYQEDAMKYYKKGFLRFLKRKKK